MDRPKNRLPEAEEELQVSVLRVRLQGALLPRETSTPQGFWWVGPDLFILFFWGGGGWRVVCCSLGSDLNGNCLKFSESHQTWTRGSIPHGWSGVTKPPLRAFN